MSDIHLLLTHLLLTLRNSLATTLEGALRSQPRGTPEWISNIHNVMLAAANRELSSRGMPLLTMEELQRIERLDVGRADYASKFALHLAERILYPGKNLGCV